MKLTDRINQENASMYRTDDINKLKEPHWIEDLIKNSELERNILEKVKNEVHVGFLAPEFLQLKYKITHEIAVNIIKQIRLSRIDF